MTTSRTSCARCAGAGGSITRPWLSGFVSAAPEKKNRCKFRLSGLNGFSDASWFSTNKINFERNEAGPIEVDNGVVCPLDSDFDMYSQWKLAPSGDMADCSGNNVINLITVGVVQTDPATLVGKTLPRVVGILRPVNIGSFNVWIIYPRGDADLTLQ